MDRKNEYLPNFDWPGLPETSYKSEFLFNPVLYRIYSKYLCLGLDLIVEYINQG